MAIVSFPSVIRSKIAILWFLLASAFLLSVFSPLPDHVSEYRDAAVNSATETVLGTRPYSPEQGLTSSPKSGPKYAYATFLAGQENDDPNDVYFLGARLLAYQLLHAPETKTGTSIPFLVMVTQSVSELKKDRLRQDGAEVVVVDDLVAEWIGDPRNNPRFKDVMTKLRVWEMTQYDRICLIDGDTVLMANIDGVFEDPAVQTRRTLENADAVRDDEAPQPSEYAFAATAEPKSDHEFPPSEEKQQYQFGPNYLNSGFMVLQPSADMFAYYVSLLDKSDGRWGEGLPEQNLLNWAHRRPEGNMPWQTLDKIWNIHFPTVVDMESGVRSLHEKFWNPEHKDLKPYLDERKTRMLRFFEERDASRSMRA